jgi:hypothetical protein
VRPRRRARPLADGRRKAAVGARPAPRCRRSDVRPARRLLGPRPRSTTGHRDHPVVRRFRHTAVRPGQPDCRQPRPRVGLLTSSGWEVRLYAKVATSMIPGALAAVGFLRNLQNACFVNHAPRPRALRLLPEQTSSRWSAWHRRGRAARAGRA